MSDNSRFVSRPGELMPAPPDAEVAPADRVSPLPFPLKEYSADQARDEQGRFAGEGAELYHATTAENADAIRQGGFHAGVGKGVGAVADDLPGVFLTSDRAEAQRYTQYLGNSPAVLSVRAEMKNVGQFADLVGPANDKLAAQYGGDAAKGMAVPGAYQQALLDVAREKGYDAVQTGGSSYVVLDPASVQVKP